MSRGVKIWLIVAASLILAGSAVIWGTMVGANWSFLKLDSENWRTVSCEVDKDFTDIYINTNTADIVFAASSDGKCRVECYEKKKAWHSVNVENNSLNIKVNDERKWYDHIGINSGSPKITVYLNKTQYDSLFIEEYTGDVEIPKPFEFKDVDLNLSTGDVEFLATADAVKIKTSTGDVGVEGAKIGELNVCVTTGEVTIENTECTGDVSVEVSTGETELDNLKCKNLLSDGDTGSISLENTIATEKFFINRSTGSIRFKDSDATEISVTTNTGSISGTLLSEKVFIAKSDTGRVDVADTTSGGKCQLTTDTGSIKIEISNKK